MGQKCLEAINVEKRLEAFHTVATAGGFTRAAEVLNGLDLTQRFIEIINYSLTDSDTSHDLASKCVHN